MATSIKVLLISVLFLVILKKEAIHGRNTGGRGYEANEYTQSEKCPDASCRSPPREIWCEANYNVKEDDGCCAEWKCSNGRTFYGIRRKTSNWNSWKSKWDNEWSSLKPVSSNLGQWGNNWIDNGEDQLVANGDPLFDRYDGRRR